MLDDQSVVAKRRADACGLALEKLWPRIVVRIELDGRVVKLGTADPCGRNLLIASHARIKTASLSARRPVLLNDGASGCNRLGCRLSPRCGSCCHNRTPRRHWGC